MGMLSSVNNYVGELFHHFSVKDTLSTHIGGKPHTRWQHSDFELSMIMKSLYNMLDDLLMLWNISEQESIHCAKLELK